MQHDFIPGTPIRFASPHGSWGEVIKANHYGGYYVKYNYGMDNFGESITATASVRPNEITEINPELYAQFIKCRAWTEEQKKIELEELKCPHAKRKTIFL